MKTKNIFTGTSLALIAAIVFFSSALAWPGSVNTEVSCDGVTVSGNVGALPYYTDNSGQSRERYTTAVVTSGEGFFPWGGSNHLSGHIVITWSGKQTSNNSGSTWSNVSGSHSENKNWSRNLPNDCKKIWICHVPEGNTNNPQTIEISINAWGNGSVGGHTSGAHGGDFGPLSGPNDASCQPKPEGCTNPDAINYDRLAEFDDGSCIARVPGCTDQNALNYNPLANVDDGSCIARVPGCTDPTALNYSPLANFNDGSCIAIVPGCTNQNANNYNPLANYENGTCTYTVYGCTDPTANNYNPLSNSDDGSCTYTVPGCTDPTANNYNQQANQNDNSCTYDVPGCTDDGALNYNPLATVNDESCEYQRYVCTNLDEGLTEVPSGYTLNEDNTCSIVSTPIPSVTPMPEPPGGRDCDEYRKLVTDNGHPEYMDASNCPNPPLSSGSSFFESLRIWFLELVGWES